MVNSPLRSTLADRIAEHLTRYSGWFILGIVVLTVLLILPIFLMAPTEPASQDPGGPMFDLADIVHDKFPPQLHITGFIVEDHEGDILRQAPLWGLYRSEQRLRDSDLSGFLYSSYNARTRTPVLSIYTMADAVQDFLVLGLGPEASLENATDLQVKAAVARVIDSPLGLTLRESLSRDAAFETMTVDGVQVQSWKAAALSVFVASDNSMLGGGPLEFRVTGEEDALRKERFNRRIHDILRGEEANYRLWGVAIDINLVSEEQGKTAIPFIAATVVLVLIVVGITLRSVSMVGLAFFGLVILLVWLKGLSNLVGLKSSLILDLVVPIAMVSLGVDFLIHAVARYREERQRLAVPRLALQAGLGGVLGALTLAMLSDGIAFLANVTSGIETIIGFGVAAGIAVGSSYLIMGIFLPLIVMRLDQRGGRAGTGTDTASVRLPAIVASGSQPDVPHSQPAIPSLQPDDPNPQPVVLVQAGIRTVVASVVLATARMRLVTLTLVALVTAGSTFLGFQLEPKLDVKDFFDSESDFVKGIDKLYQYRAPSVSGEPAVIYIRGDLTATESLSAIRELFQRLNDVEQLGRRKDGQVSVYSTTLLELLSWVMRSEYAVSQVQAQTGVVLTDADGDQVPDDAGQIRAAYDYMVQFGIPEDTETLAFEPTQVQEVLYHQIRNDTPQEVIITVGVLGASEQANIGSARRALEKVLEPLRDTESIEFVGVTGSPFTRDAALTAATRALNISLPVAVAGCFILLAFWSRSIRYALVTVVPIALVVSWLYAFMYVAGFHLNFVTATIAAVSIGVGIDYSIHVTQRFRQELARQPSTEEALRATAAGTGVALVGSAASSIIGFAVMGFAPMPLFSAYGIITAAMILLAAVAALLVLPSLLLLVAGKPVGEDG